MINLHILHHTIQNDSRVLRESGSIHSSGLFDEVHVCALEEKDADEEYELHGRKVWGITLRSRSLPKHIFGQFIKYLEWHWKVVRRYHRMPIAVIHCHDWLPLLMALHLRRHTGAKVVYDAHEIEAEVQGLRGIRKSIVRIIERFFVRKADLVIVVGEAIRQYYEDTYGPERTIVIMNCPHAVDVEKTGILREELGIPEPAVIFMYVGGLTSGRGIELMLEVFPDVNASVSVAVFMGYGPLREKIAQMAASYDTIFLKEAVPPDEVVGYLASADVGMCVVEDVSLSYRLSLPNKLFECLMARLPVIVSDLPELSRVVTEWEVGIVLNDLTPGDLRKGMERMFAMDLETLATRARAASEFFSWQQQERILIDAYRELLGLPGDEGGRRAELD